MSRPRLRQLEAVALLAVVIDVATTDLMVGSGQATEVGLVASRVYPVAGGWGLAAVLLGVVVAAFALVRRWSRAPAWAAGPAVGLLAANAARNLLITVSHPPESVLWEPWATVVATTAAGAVLFWWRPDLVQGFQKIRSSLPILAPPHVREVAVASVALAVVLSATFAGVPLPGTLPNVPPAAGTASAEPYNLSNDSVLWGTIGSSDYIGGINPETGEPTGQNITALPSASNYRDHEMYYNDSGGWTVATFDYNNDDVELRKYNDHGILEWEAKITTDSYVGEEKRGSVSWTANGTTILTLTGSNGNTQFTRVLPDGEVDVRSKEYSTTDSAVGDVGPNGYILLGREFCCGSQKTQFLSPDFNTVWERSNRSTEVTLVDDNGYLYQGNNNGQIQRFSRSDGSIIWQVTPSGFADTYEMAVNNGYLYASNSSGLAKIDITDGSVVWTRSTGIASQTTLFDKDGDVIISSGSTIKKISSSDGTLIWEDSGDKKSSTLSFGYGGSGSASSGQSDLEGQVETCPASAPDCSNPSPLSNATVEVYAVDHSAITASGAQSLEDRADELLKQSRNITPPDWNPAEQLLGQGGKFASPSATFPLAHTRSDWNPGNIFAIKEADVSLKQDPDLATPATTIPSGEAMYLTLWEPGGGLYEDNVDGDIPGAVTTDGTLRIEQVAATGESIETFTTKVQYEANGRVRTATKTHHVARLNLPDGFYRITAVESGNTVLVSVGDPGQTRRLIRKDLEQRKSALKDKASQLSERAQTIRDRVKNNKFQRTVTTTNATGHFSVSFSDSNLKTVGIQVIRMDGSELFNAKNRTPSAMVDRIEATDYNGSIYVAPTTVTDVPDRNVSIKALEVGRPMYQNVSDFRDWYDWLQGKLGKESYMGLAAALQDPPGELTEQARTEAREAVNETRDIVNESSDLTRADVREIVENASAYKPVDPDIDLDLPSSAYNTSELRTVLQAQEQALSQLADTVDQEPPTVEVVQPSTDDAESAAEDTTEELSAIDAQFGFGQDFAADDVRVLAHWANGTSRTVDQQYWSVNKRPGQGDLVAIQQFPIGSNDPGAVTFQVTLATEDGGVSEVEKRVTNPEKETDPPTLRSISFSSLKPGPNETVQVGLTAADGSSFKEISNVSVYHRGALLASPNVTDGTDFAFDTSGAGTYRLRLELLDTSGATTVLTTAIEAGEEDLPRQPGIRVTRDPAVGRYTLTGDGIQSATVARAQGGSRLDVTARVDADDAPGTLRIYTHDTTGTDQTIRVSAVRASDGSRLESNIPVMVHGPTFPDGAHVRIGGEPIPEGGNQYGQVERVGGASKVTTYLRGGSVEITANTNPTLFDEAGWWFDRTMQGLGGVPLLSVGIVAPLKLLLGLLPLLGWWSA